MNNISELKQQRWLMITNTNESIVDDITDLKEIEITEHTLWIDAVTSGKQLSRKDMLKCRKRFIRTFAGKGGIKNC